MRVLLATDGAKETTVGLQAAGRLLRNRKHQADVLCVAPELPVPRKQATAISAEERTAYQQRITEETGRILEAAQATLRASGIEAAPIMKIGSPAGQIARLAGEYDLTVVGARGKAATGSMGLGPVASRVVETVPGAILIAREPATERRLKILVGVDGSDALQRGLTLLTEGFDIRLAEITLLHVVETPWVQFGMDREWFAYNEGGASASQWQQELRLEAETLIDDARRQLADSDVSIVPIIAEGNAATEILDELESDDYDLVLVGASGKKDVKQQVLGSVSAKLIWHSPCSALVVKA
ncbi:MAG: universal stress protein [Blastocatellia bacterium]